MKWIEYARGEIPPFTVGLIVFGMLKYSGELIGSPFREIIHSHYDGKTRWGWKKRDVSEIGRHLLNKFSDKEKYSGYLSKYASVITESSIASGSIINSDISVLDKDMLLKRYEEFVLSNMRFHALTMDIDVIDLILEERMMAKIREIITDERELSKAYALITTPSTLSYTAREEIAILETASKKASKKEFMDCIHELSREFWWTSLGWNFGKIKEVQYFLDAATLKKNEAESKLNKKKKLHRETEDAKKKLFEKLGFDKDFMFLHQIFEDYASLHDLRKEFQMKSVYASEIMLKEISKRFKIRNPEWYWPHEISQLFKNVGKIDEMDMKLRRNALTIIAKDAPEFYYGREAIMVAEKEFGISSEEISSFSGIAASPGMATGTARVAHSYKEAEAKIMKGDILVTGMTTPDFMPSMKKISAIVTDEGGITSHAAVISREMNIPCIVGTGIATKMLKDGMKIEVDAYQNVVKVLK